MNKSNHKIFCVIPAYNEGKTIAEVVSSVKPYVDEIVVVDDGSVEEARRYLVPASGIIVLRHIINRGQGAALRTGTRYALKNGADIVVHFDADGQFAAREIGDVVKPIIKGEADVVFGSRFLSKRSEIPWFKRSVIIPLARLFNKIFLGVNLTDPQSGFRALSREAARKISINQDRMSHCSEILHKASVGGFKIKEAPITVVYHDFGQKFSGGVKIIKELFLGRLIN